jgi:hypothetical protein
LIRTLIHLDPHPDPHHRKDTPMHPLSGLLLHLTMLVRADRRRDDRGDVPGWVMVTLMTAIVVAALTPFVGAQLRTLLEQAFAMVSG